MNEKQDQGEVFVTSIGVVLPLRHISPLLVEKARASIPIPERPTYTAETVSGVIEVHPHDDTTLETDEDRAEWQNYLMQRALVDRQINERVTMLLFRRGINFDALKLPKDDKWIKEQEEVFGIEVPDDPIERKIHWVETEALATTDDIKLLIVKLMAMTGAPKEVVAAAERSFRRPVEGDATGEPADQEGGVELQPELSGGEGGAGVGQDA